LAVARVAFSGAPDFPAALAFLSAAHRSFVAAMLRARPSGIQAALLPGGIRRRRRRCRLALPRRRRAFPLRCRLQAGVAHWPTTICGVAIVGRRVARLNHDGFTAEVKRVAPDGSENA
jgi:hypothetical protein